MARFWTCSRTTAGVRCRAKNSGRLRKCVACGKPRPARKRPAHMKALDLSYESYVQLNGGEACGICGATASANRRLDRDHQHTGDGIPRGLLCHGCNRSLGFRDEAWLLAALKYVQRNARPEGEVAA